MRGRKPEDTTLTGELPKPPKHLDAEARKEWKRIIPILPGIDAREMALLSIYCQAWSRVVKCETQINKNGLIIRSPKGHKIQSPYLAILNRSNQVVERVAAKLGLSPLSRSHIRSNTSAKTTSEFDGLLAGSDTVRIAEIG